MSAGRGRRLAVGALLAVATTVAILGMRAFVAFAWLDLVRSRSFADPGNGEAAAAPRDPAPAPLERACEGP